MDFWIHLTHLDESLPLISVRSHGYDLFRLVYKPHLQNPNLFASSVTFFSSLLKFGPISSILFFSRVFCPKNSLETEVLNRSLPWQIIYLCEKRLFSSSTTMHLIWRFPMTSGGCLRRLLIIK